MLLSRAVSSVLGAFSVLCLAAGCGDKAGGSKGEPGGASTAGGAGSGPSLGISGNGNASKGGTNSIGEECAADLVAAKRIPLDMYVMLDVSGSMLLPTEGDALVTKWQAVSSALTAFVSDEDSAGIGMGLQVFPILQKEAPSTCVNDADCAAFGPCINRACWPLIDGNVVGCFDANGCELGQACVVLGECTENAEYVCNRDATAVCGQGFGDCEVPASICLSQTDCRAAVYAAPAAEIAELPGARAALVAAIDAAEPDPAGLTPTGPALQGAISQAKAWAAAHPDRQVVAVLATDGLPTLQTQGAACAPVLELADIDAVVGLANSGRTTTPAISTFVIGVVGSDDVGAPVILDAIAQAGGSTEAFIINTAGNVQADFRAALNAIRETGLSCDLAVPEERAGAPVDYDLVNVDFTNKDGTVETLVKVADAKSCASAPAGHGWYYDSANTSVTRPTRISVCPAMCKEFQATDMGSVAIALGCASRVVK